MISPGFDVNSKFEIHEKSEALEEEEIERKKKLSEEIEVEIDRQKKWHKEASIHESIKTTNVLLNECQKKLDMHTFDLHKCDKELNNYMTVMSKKEKAKKCVIRE